MLKVFYSVRAYQQYLLAGNLELGLQADGSVSVDRPDYWPIGVVQGWLDGMDAAKEDVSRYAIIDPELYDKICGHIETEAVSNMYIILEMHGYSINAKQRKEYIDRLWYDIEWLHLENLCMRSKQMFTGWLSAL